MEARIPPQATDIEEAVLGAMLIEQDCVDEVMNTLSERDFYKPAHQKVFSVFQELYSSGEAIDVLTAENVLKDRGGFEGIDLISMTSSVGSAANVSYYCQIIREKAMRRNLIAKCTEVISKSYDPSTDTMEVMDFAQESVFSASEGKNGSLRNMAEVMNRIVHDIHQIQENGRPMGLRTGLDIDSILSGFQGSKLYVLGARPSMGKDQPLYSKIKTVKGWTTMGEIRIGDEIASVDGRKNHVIGVYPQGKRPVYEITFSDGRRARCGIDHLWRVHNRKWASPKVLSTREIIDLLEKPSFRNRIWVDLVSGDFGSKPETEIDPWLLGYLIGNGTLRDSDVQVSTDDAQSIHQIRQSIPKGHSMHYKGQYDYSIKGADGNKNEILNNLRELNLSGSRSWEKEIPGNFLLADKYTRLQLLRGLMDSDGWSEKSGSVRYSTSSKKLAYQVQELIRSLGGLCQISKKMPKYTYKGESKIGRQHYTCKIRINDPEQAFTLYRKKSRAKNSRSVRLTISTIRFIGEEETQCIQVSHPSETYITDGYVVTHNTAFSMTILRRLAKDGHNAGIISLETSDKSLGIRLISQVANISADIITSGSMTAEQMERVSEAMSELSGYGILIDDEASVNIQKLRSKCRMMVAKGAELIFVDFLQLLQSQGRSKHEEIGNITKALKQISKELDIPIVALSQLSRKVEDRQDKRPQMSDLRESGSIEEDADVILFLYRPEYYGITTTAGGESTEGICDVIIAKNKDGKTGIKSLRFIPAYTRFENMAYQYQEPVESWHEPQSDRNDNIAPF